MRGLIITAALLLAGCYANTGQPVSVVATSPGTVVIDRPPLGPTMQDVMNLATTECARHGRVAVQRDMVIHEHRLNIAQRYTFECR